MPLHGLDDGPPVVYPLVFNSVSHGKERIEPVQSLDLDLYTSRFGGIPEWFRENIPENTGPSSWNLCRNCGKPLTFVCQMYAPVTRVGPQPADGHQDAEVATATTNEHQISDHRLLHLFACGHGCGQWSKGWRLYRSNLRSKAAETRREHHEPAGCEERDETRALRLDEQQLRATATPKSAVLSETRDDQAAAENFYEDDWGATATGTTTTAVDLDGNNDLGSEVDWGLLAAGKDKDQEDEDGELAWDTAGLFAGGRGSLKLTSPSTMHEPAASVVSSITRSWHVLGAPRGGCVSLEEELTYEEPPESACLPLVELAPAWPSFHMAMAEEPETSNSRLVAKELQRAEALLLDYCNRAEEAGEEGDAAERKELLREARAARSSRNKVVGKKCGMDSTTTDDDSSSSEDEDDCKPKQQGGASSSSGGGKNKNGDCSTSSDDDDFGFGGSSSTRDKSAKRLRKAWQKFQKAMQKSPDQVLRYNFGAKKFLHLAPSRKELPRVKTTTSAATKIVKGTGKNSPSSNCCVHCGARRVFEFSLLPTFLYQMMRSCPKTVAKQFKDVEKAVELDFGMVHAFTCSADCAAARQGLVEEEIVVEAET